MDCNKHAAVRKKTEDGPTHCVNRVNRLDNEVSTRRGEKGGHYLKILHNQLGGDGGGGKIALQTGT